MNLLAFLFGFLVVLGFGYALRVTNKALPIWFCRKRKLCFCCFFEESRLTPGDFQCAVPDELRDKIGNCSYFCGRHLREKWPKRVIDWALVTGRMRRVTRPNREAVH
jgi:hypothetical protein